MIELEYYSNNGLNNEDEVFEYLLDTIKPGIVSWDYFTNWKKVTENTKKFEIVLNKMTSLLVSNNFDKDFLILVKKHPDVLTVITALLGLRNDKQSVSYMEGDVVKYESFDLSYNSKPSSSDAKKALEFIKNSGLVCIFQEGGVKNLKDFLKGVEAGLDTNARKNRSGFSMESIVEFILKKMSVRFICQANDKNIKQEFEDKVKGISWDNFSRAAKGKRFDFVVEVGGNLFVIEVNNYSGGGSKLGKTADSYRDLQEKLRGLATFIWITEGKGWLTTKDPLREAFDNNDYIFNLEMADSGALQEVFGLK